MSVSLWLMAISVYLLTNGFSYFMGYRHGSWKVALEMKQLRVAFIKKFEEWHHNLMANGFHLTGLTEAPTLHDEICGVYHGRECNCSAQPLMDRLTKGEE